MINKKNLTLEISKPELGNDEGTIQFDGQTYQISINPSMRSVLPNGAVVRGTIAVDDSASGLNVPESTEARS